MHHGTLLLSADLSKLPGYLNVSDEKLRSKGVSSVRSRVCNLCELNPQITNQAMIEALRQSFSEEYGTPGPGSWTKQPEGRLQSFTRSRLLGNGGWGRRRGSIWSCAADLIGERCRCC